MAAAVAPVVAVGDGDACTGLSDRGRGWMEPPALAAASSSNLAVALADSTAVSGADAGVLAGVLAVEAVISDVLLAAVGVLGLLLLPLPPLPLPLFCRIRSTSEGRAFNFGRGCNPSIQERAENDWL